MSNEKSHVEHYIQVLEIYNIIAVYIIIIISIIIIYEQ